ncbi:sigma 54-interacting transcriptional regulator [Thiosulfativibrio zosterae]|uniref:Transcriptional regulator n=1 Tax=Thiosulfativibrio zosterae TaxID=2675053 RepID=A0A6F8PMW8_9GAMM|nr:sigma 54-interacting transcriptional regulator [Thiosulfativibrio zosterae]BBP43452.1 transcriptional regulator [Thiosulfativibrio zosterae]
MSQIFSDAFNKNPNAMIIIDPVKDEICYVNLAAEALLKQSNKTLTTLKATQLFRHCIPTLFTFTEEALIKTTAWTRDLHIQFNDDQPIYLEVSAGKISQNSNQRKEFICLTLQSQQEINRRRIKSDAKFLHQNGLEHWKTIEHIFREFEHENKLILEAAGEGIYGVDIHGKTTFINPAAEKILGWKSEELIGKSMHEMIHHSREDGNHYESKNCHIYAAFRDGEVRHVDNEIFWHKNNYPIPVEYTSTPIMDNHQLIGAVVIFRDVSERKLAERKLHEALNEVQSLKKRLELENAYLQEEYREEHHYKEIVGKSLAIRKVIQQIELVAPTDASVLISGESGTGKELIARAIHDSSQHKNRPLIRVNCASIPRELFESEFFGHVKGAFTGAINDRAGRFELANGGTLFLDEVGEIPFELQGKLLRVLQEQQFERVGESKTRSVDVRIIAATNRDLKEEVAKKQFREDLFFRLNVFPIESIPLRERTEDIPLLANHLLKIARKKFVKPNIQLTVGDIQKLIDYQWPGNIRELLNVIERGIILATDSRLELNLPLTNQNYTSLKNDIENTFQIQTKQELSNLDKQNIINALKACRGKIFGQNGAAEALKIKPTTLASRIKKYQINRHQYIN